MLYKRLGACDLQDIMRRFNRDYFSYHGYQALIDFYEEMDEDVAVDPIAISCEWCEEDPIEIYDKYSYFLNHIETPNTEDDVQYQEWIAQFIDELNEFTWAQLLDNGSVLYFQL